MPEGCTTFITAASTVKASSTPISASLSIFLTVSFGPWPGGIVRSIGRAIRQRLIAMDGTNRTFCLCVTAARRCCIRKVQPRWPYQELEIDATAVRSGLDRPLFPYFSSPFLEFDCETSRDLLHQTKASLRTLHGRPFKNR